ncbi:MAG: hypothetical protein RMX59_000300 [Nostoc sp. DedSLP05]
MTNILFWINNGSLTANSQNLPVFAPAIASLGQSRKLRMFFIFTYNPSLALKSAFYLLVICWLIFMHKTAGFVRRSVYDRKVDKT